MSTAILVGVWIGSVWYECGLYVLPSIGVRVGGGMLNVSLKEPWIRRPERINWTGIEENDALFDWSFDARQHTYVTGVTQTWIDIPLWSIALFAGIPAAMFWHRDWPCRSPGLCRKCRYDLRGTERDVCPECGAAVASQCNT